jgi:hypothetical protein
LEYQRRSAQLRGDFDDDYERLDSRARPTYSGLASRAHYADASDSDVGTPTSSLSPSPAPTVPNSPLTAPERAAAAAAAATAAHAYSTSTGQSPMARKQTSSTASSSMATGEVSSDIEMLLQSLAASSASAMGRLVHKSTNSASASSFSAASAAVASPHLQHRSPQRASAAVVSATGRAVSPTQRLHNIFVQDLTDSLSRQNALYDQGASVLDSHDDHSEADDDDERKDAQSQQSDVDAAAGSRRAYFASSDTSSQSEQDGSPNAHDDQDDDEEEAYRDLLARGLSSSMAKSSPAAPRGHREDLASVSSSFASSVSQSQMPATPLERQAIDQLVDKFLHQRPDQAALLVFLLGELSSRTTLSSDQLQDKVFSVLSEPSTANTSAPALAPAANATSSTGPGSTSQFFIDSLTLESPNKQVHTTLDSRPTFSYLLVPSRADAFADDACDCCVCGALGPQPSPSRRRTDPLPAAVSSAHAPGHPHSIHISLRNMTPQSPPPVLPPVHYGINKWL